MHMRWLLTLMPPVRHCSLAAVAAFALVGFPLIVYYTGWWGFVKYWLMPWLGYHFWMSEWSRAWFCLAGACLGWIARLGPEAGWWTCEAGCGLAGCGLAGGLSWLGRPLA